MITLVAHKAHPEILSGQSLRDNFTLFTRLYISAVNLPLLCIFANTYDMIVRLKKYFTLSNSEILINRLRCARFGNMRVYIQS